MVNYPVEFNSESETDKGEKTWSLETDEGLESAMSVPEEFGGDNENPSPEDLFNASLGSCILATFKVTAERKCLGFDEIEVESTTALDRNEEGRPVMKRALITVSVKGVSDRTLAEETAEIAEKNCFIHNSVKTEVDLEFNLEN
jgi:organic hydroperoxide reductase OsmC/OhrA